MIYKLKEKTITLFKSPESYIDFLDFQYNFFLGHNIEPELSDENLIFCFDDEIKIVILIDYLEIKYFNGVKYYDLNLKKVLLDGYIGWVNEKYLEII